MHVLGRDEAAAARGNSGQRARRGGARPSPAPGHGGAGRPRGFGERRKGLRESCLTLLIERDPRPPARSPSMSRVLGAGRLRSHGSGRRGAHAGGLARSAGPRRPAHIKGRRVQSACISPINSISCRTLRAPRPPRQPAPPGRGDERRPVSVPGGGVSAHERLVPVEAKFWEHSGRRGAYGCRGRRGEDPTSVFSGTPVSRAPRTPSLTPQVSS